MHGVGQHHRGAGLGNGFGAGDASRPDFGNRDDGQTWRVLRVWAAYRMVVDEEAEKEGMRCHL